ncbi:flavin reductase family protein [Streptomyces sp. MUM 203J]|uniref:flavin reductase family protein n=1 Tax=Streptomyces sp. MUM 203J TaxID=2791990 RepID=UPI001F0470E5|nr:flavin reductase family protein [Streptomyces sp. MUM 203J]MCH0538346.1 flavin reductase family protein [Streptomyces sp. MUM 203J]
MTGTDSDARLFRRVAGRFATGVTVVTTQADDGPFGMTANSFTTVSLDPRLVLVCVGERARIREHLVTTGAFALTVLGAAQQATARRFADPARPPGAAGFADDAWAPGPATGNPVLLDGTGWFDCAVRDIHPAGDHSIVVGEVQAFSLLPAEQPLLFSGGRFLTAAAHTLEVSA